MKLLNKIIINIKNNRHLPILCRPRAACASGAWALIMILRKTIGPDPISGADPIRTSHHRCLGPNNKSLTRKTSLLSYPKLIPLPEIRTEMAVGINDLYYCSLQGGNLNREPEGRI